ncbi:MAG: hypothetical protein KA138_05645 [Saprospiraceae bacterium]|jgi:hypothetical protein|nr:hypothetical protein [Saprospiraceae bacterium]
MEGFNRERAIYIFILGILMFTTFACKQNDKHQDAEKFSIERLNMFSMVYDYPINDSVVHKTKMEIYLVSGYEDTMNDEQAIDSFTCANISTDYDKYNSYYIAFYKKSEVTNIENLTKNPKDWDDYSLSNDRICDYTWRDGSFRSSNKWVKDNPTSYRYKIPCFKNPGYD